MVENAPPRTHVFEAPGFFEQIMEEVSENATVTPMRVYVAPGETVHVQGSTAQLSCEPETDGSEAQTCPFFCPLRKECRGQILNCVSSTSHAIKTWLLVKGCGPTAWSLPCGGSCSSAYTSRTVHPILGA